MKIIDTKGIPYIELLEGSHEWYWGMDYTGGDLYEAEEIFKLGPLMNPNRLLFIHYPDGRIVQPVTAANGRYFGRPIYYNDKIIILTVDFTTEQIEIIQYDDAAGQTSSLAAVSLSAVDDCYNLMLKKSPLMLIRHGSDHKFQILWPERITFHVNQTETLYFRIDEKLYFSAWYEDPDYREEIIVRRLDTGEIIDQFAGNLEMMPDGQLWLLR